MSAVAGERDTLIMNTVPRHAAPIDRALMLAASATVFEVSLGGAPTPDAITFSALMLGAVGEIVFSSEPPVALAVINGNAVLRYQDMHASIVTVTASAMIDGITYHSRQTVAKQQALDLTPPPAPTGLVATGHAATITLAWNAVPANYNNLSHTEVWRAPVNDFAQAALAGRADGGEYTDPVGPGAFRYYWARHVSRAAIPGPYNAGSGTMGASDAEVGHLLGVLTGEITQSQLHADLGARIDLVDGPASAAGSVAARLAAETAARAAAISAEAQTRAGAIAGEASRRAQALVEEAQARENGIATEQTTRANADGALSTRIDAVVATSGANTAAITAEQHTRSEADGALSGRIDLVLATSNGNTAAIMAEQTARTNADSAMSSRIDSVTASAGANTADITAEKTARTSADAALATDIASVVASVASNSAAITIEATARASADMALSERVETVSAAAAENAAAISSEASTRASADGALASRVDTLVAVTGANTAAIVAEQTARSTEDGALSKRVDAVMATSSSNTASITAEQNARAEADGELAGLIDTISVKAGANAVAIQTESKTRATQTGDLYAQYTVKQDVNGYVSGYGLASTANNSAPTSAFAVRADTFYIANPSGPGIAPSMPFIVRSTATVVDGVTIPIGTYIADAFIQNASITNAKIGGDIWSNNWVSGSSGWYLSRAGNLEVNNLHARGSLSGGVYTSYAWPRSGGTGFYIGQEGALFGSPASGQYLQLTSTGGLYAPGITLANGGATFSGVLLGASGTFAGALTAASGTLGVITSGYLRNASNSAFVNLDAVGEQPFISAGNGALRLNVDGSGRFARAIISEPIVVAHGPTAISVGWVGNVSGVLKPFTVYIDTNISFPAAWNEAATEGYIANATISFGESEAGGCSGYTETTIVVGDGLINGNVLGPIDQRIYLRVTWTPILVSGNTPGRIFPRSIEWKMVKT